MEKSIFRRGKEFFPARFPFTTKKFNTKSKEIHTSPSGVFKLRTQIRQSQGNQNKSLPVSRATRNDRLGVPTMMLAYSRLAEFEDHK